MLTKTPPPTELQIPATVTTLGVWLAVLELGLVAICRSVSIREMNRVNSRSGLATTVL